MVEIQLSEVANYTIIGLLAVGETSGIIAGVVNRVVLIPEHLCVTSALECLDPRLPADQTDKVTITACASAKV